MLLSPHNLISALLTMVKSKDLYITVKTTQFPEFSIFA